jgi:hypothetical protein
LDVDGVPDGFVEFFGFLLVGCDVGDLTENSVYSFLRGLTV